MTSVEFPAPTYDAEMVVALGRDQVEKFASAFAAEQTEDLLTGVGKALWNRLRGGLFPELPADRNRPIQFIHRQ